jgi:sulfur carrier protein
MKITLNNRLEEFKSETMTIADILTEKNFTFKMLVIKLNMKFIEKTDYSKTFVKENDDLQIIHLISGG